MMQSMAVQEMTVFMRVQETIAFGEEMETTPYR